MRSCLKAVKFGSCISALVIALSLALSAQVAQGSPDGAVQTMPHNTIQGAQTTSSQLGSQQGLAAPTSNVTEVPTFGSLASRLHLTPAQNQKLSAVLQNDSRQISAVEGDQSLTTAQKNKRIRDIRRRDGDRIKSFLTADQERELLALQANAGPPPQSGRNNRRAEKK